MRLLLKMKIISMYGTQSRFAQTCGKSDDWISRIIKGRYDPNDEEKDIIISKLKVDYGDDLFAKVNI